ncbi:hypothetical protein B7463_g6142, partial [Scytalidium lignicola]
MLKTTYRPANSSNTPPPLPPGWTEHKAPTGHTYYYNAETKQSTYKRPAGPAQQATPTPPPPAISPSQSFLQYQAIANPIPNARAPFNNDQFSAHGGRGGFHNQGGDRGNNERFKPRGPQPIDKPKSRHPIPGCEPWELVSTKYGRRFVYNTVKKQSFWRIPDKLKDGILQLDQERIKEKAAALSGEKKPTENSENITKAKKPAVEREEHTAEGAEDSSEYEEVEVTDDEEDDDPENAAKRQRTEQPVQEEPIEFNEDDIAHQLAAMGQEYGLDPGEYGDDQMEDWEEGAEGLELSYEDSAALFKDLLNDYNINPYSPWEKLVEEGKLVDDTRYTALTTMKSRREVWEEWSREKVKVLRELRAKQEKKDPKIPYLAFLEKHATLKLYWPEFKRKFRKDLKEFALPERDQEKLYREHVSRLKLPVSSLKSDLTALLKSQPASILNNTSSISSLSSEILKDIRYISLNSQMRDEIIEAYISTLPPPPEGEIQVEDEEKIKERKEKERRQKALEERERQVAEQKRQQKRNLEFGKGRLREEEVEIARAMQVTKKGLMDHLVEKDKADGSANPV